MRRSLTDQLNRPLRDLRISVTDRCNFRCSYCMPIDMFGHDHQLSGRGALLRFDGDDAPAVGTAVTLDLPEIGTIDARMVRRYEGGMGARFEYFEETVRDRLIQRIFTKGMNNASVTGSPAEIAKALFMRAFG